MDIMEWAICGKYQIMESGYMDPLMKWAEMQENL